MSEALQRTLSGRGILVTRPRGQADALAALIRARGGEPILCPTIAIEPCIDAPAATAVIARLAQFDVAIFISANAVEHGLACIRAHGVWPAQLTAVAVGPGTANALRKAGITTILMPPERFDSEGMLDLPALEAPQGKRIVIVRGVGGREWLGAELECRGAHVEVAEVYVRRPAAIDVGPLIVRWRQGAVAAVVATSAEALTNLMLAIGPLGASEQAMLRETPTVVTHSRVAAHARALGLTCVLESASGDPAIVAILEGFFARVTPSPGASSAATAQ
jgi:uroporphyrinogen-III synthase